VSQTDERIRVERSPARCPYCHGDLTDPDAVTACASCGARHHAGCHREHGVCASCGADGRLVPEPGGAASRPEPLSESDERQWAMFCHMSGFAGHVVPFGNVILPYVLWQNKKDASPYVDRQGCEAFNFQLTILILVLMCIPLLFVLIGFVLLPVLGLLHAVFTLLGTIRASQGVDYRYPFSIPFLKPSSATSAPVIKKNEG
jgi:uncharacterized Tic20 family protein